MISRLACALLLATAACQTGPLNGDTFGGSVAGKSLALHGYYDKPNAFISIQVMREPTLDPNDDASWIQFASATTSTTPQQVGSGDDPLYPWSTTGIPVPANPTATQAKRWPQGGLARLRAMYIAPNFAETRLLTTFDRATFADCIGDHPGADWMTMGQECAGLGTNNVVIVSTTNVPVLPGNAGAFSPSGFLGKKDKITPGQTVQYYNATGAPATLAAFRSKYNFSFGGEVIARYYNDGDLGIGREMHCQQFTNPFGQGLACYVTNYSGVVNASGVGVPAFDVNPDVVLADTLSGVHEFATVAMVYDPPAGLPNSVKFIVYDAAGNRANTAILDNTQNNTSIPNNCLNCHGINSSYNPATLSVSGNAEFLPFDPFSYKYSKVNSNYSFEGLESEFRQLNKMVRAASPTPAVLEYIDGLYAPLGVNDTNATANADFVPPDWANANASLDGTAVYTGLVRVGCRTCHMSASDAALDFADASDFSAKIAQIRTEVCSSSRIMPHAEHVMKRFWQSGARAYLITGYDQSGGDPLGACK